MNATVLNQVPNEDLTGDLENSDDALRVKAHIQRGLDASNNPDAPRTTHADFMGELKTELRMTLADQECFAQALLAPPQPSPALERAFARRRKLLGAE
ncbi:type II toxin -antitoxin system TacA 1-like antitoxin [Glaciimonas sp. GG7]